MTKRTPALTVAAAAAFLATLACSTARLDALTVGDAAPALKPAKWIKGEPVSEFKNGQTYVVEFWATWCPPCKESIPHLTELQKKHKDVIFIGQDVSEQDDAAVEPFVKEMGDKMNYRVATDDKSATPDGVMNTTWMVAAHQDGIPTAFIVNKEGKVAWIGHPMEMEPVLDKVLAGNYDLEAAKKDAATRDAKQAAMQAAQEAFQTKVGPALQSKDYAGAAKAIDEIIAAQPAIKSELLGAKFNVLLQAKEYDQAYAVADEVATIENDNAMSLNELAWTIAAAPTLEKRDLDRALKFAQRAVEVTQGKNADTLDTLARVYSEKNDAAKAVETEEKAIAAAGPDSPQVGAMKQTLDQYKAKQK